ncbi:MAG: histidine phosphatase family protein [archaeon]|nr:histidine phosphatase family protein [archaeon]
MKLIIVRHGETIENQKKILMGHLPGILSSNGIEQAKTIALKLKEEKIDAIYSSDLARAADTAKEIAKFHPHIKLILSQELRERFIGTFQGKPREEVGWRTILGKDSIIPQPKNMESMKQLFERANLFLKKIKETHKNQTVVIVAHYGIITALICVIDGKKAEDINESKSLGNTEICSYQIND